MARHSLETTGEPFPVVPFGSDPSVVGSTLVYAPVGPYGILSQIVEVDRTGSVVRTIGEPRHGLLPSLALSPDGRRAVDLVLDSRGFDLWLFDLQSGEPTRLTFQNYPSARSPVWSPDGAEVVFTVAESSENIRMFAARVDGSETREFGEGSTPVTFVGDSVVYGLHAEGFDYNLWMKKIDDPGKGEPLLADPGWETRPAISPDGRLLAYQKDDVVLIRTFPELTGPWQAASNCAAPR